jgi:hypothetical protein
VSVLPQVLRDSWQTWQEWRVARQGEASAEDRAIGFLRNAMLGKAWNTWLGLHILASKAKNVGIGSLVTDHSR